MKFGFPILLLALLSISAVAEDESTPPPRVYPVALPNYDEETATRLQIFLDNSDFGPGKIDGRMGEFFRNRGELMPEVIVRKGEPVDRALKRLKSKLDAEGILDEVRRLRAFETPNQKSRRKAKANAKRGRTKFRFNPNG